MLRIRKVTMMITIAAMLPGTDACALAEVSQAEMDLALSRLRTMLVGPNSGEVSAAMRKAAAGLDDWVDAALKRIIRDKSQEHYGAVDPVYESDRVYWYTGIAGLLPPSVRLATAYACRASKHYHNPAVKEAVELSLRYVMKRAYPGCPKVHNWWCWEMAMPEQICDLLLLMNDDLSPDARDSFARLLDEINPPKPIEPRWKSYHSAMLAFSAFRSGLILRDQQRLDLALQGMKRATQWPWDMGMQLDYSNHDMVGNTDIGGMDLGYNNGMLSAVGRYVYATRGAGMQLDAHSIQGVTGYILEFHRWNIWRGWGGSPFLNGRGVASPRHMNGDYESVGASLYLAAAGVQRADELVAFMKRMFQELPRIVEAPSVGNLALSEEIQRSPVPAEKSPVGCRFWPWNEYMIYRTPLFCASVLLSGAAKPTIPWYQINNESPTAWHGRDGNLVVLHDSWDLGPDLFPTWDWDRLTGITTEEGSHYQSFEKSRNPFSGGVTLDAKAGVAGMDLRVGALEARKSYTFFDECVISQASRGRSTKHAETVVHQVPLRTLKDPIWADGRQLALEPGKTTLLRGIHWLHAGRGGYAFPGGADVTVLLEERSGTWRAVNEPWGSTDEVRRPYLQVLIDHGTPSADTECLSVMWPAADLGSMESRARAFDRSIKALRTPNIHGVKTPGFRALVFFEPGEVEGYTLDRPGCLMVRWARGSGRLAVSEPSLRGKEIVVALPFAVDADRLPEYVAVAAKPNVLRVSLKDGLQREFDVYAK